MINQFNDVEARNSGIIYKSTLEQIKKLYAVDPEQAGELAIAAIELTLAGQFSSDDVIIELISNRITKEDCQNGYILDGFPRTQVQAEKYDELLERLGKDLGVVIYINIEKDMMNAEIGFGRKVLSVLV